MPRQARIDAPGAFHHIICRGLERRRIFRDDADRDDFVSRLGCILQKTSTRCFAWVLIPNHFHLLLQTGTTPIATVMRRLLTGHACYFNRRHDRCGHLFQNRYKSILCQEDPYFLELVRYIHLNPIRARLVSSMEELKKFRHCGHASLLGIEPVPWQTSEDVLLRFSQKLAVARSGYEAFVAEKVSMGKRPELTGVGLIRSTGGWQRVLQARGKSDAIKSDERILGDSDFVESVISAAKERQELVDRRRQQGLEFERVAQIVADLLQIDVADVWDEGKQPTRVVARSLLCYWATHELGMTATETGRRLKLSHSAASRAVERGKQLASDRGWHLE